MIWDVVASFVALPVVAAAAYLAFLAAMSRRAPARPRPGRLETTFDVIVPAHNEEGGIAATVQSLLSIDYPRALFRVIVVADNCTDATAERASAAGATVLTRHAPDVRGKGHALAFAFDRSLRDAFADAVVLVDADSVVSPNLLSAFAVRFAAGGAALQADYGVRNADSSWRTRLMHVSFTAFHTVRSLARERMELSCGLRGNGMAFSRSLLRAVPHRAFSVVEDIEYGIALGLAGVRVHYVAEAHVLGDMCGSETHSRPQRRRWEDGRSALTRQYAWPLLRAAIRTRDVVLFDLAADLLTPPLGQVVAVAALGALVCGAALACGRPLHAAPWLWATAIAGIVAHVGRAVVLSGAGVRAFFDLAWAPFYIVWKLTLPLRLRGSQTRDWVRTRRAFEAE
jgi:GT2 family glycosyltransferase